MFAQPSSGIERCIDFLKLAGLEVRSQLFHLILILNKIYPEADWAEICISSRQPTGKEKQGRKLSDAEASSAQKLSKLSPFRSLFSLKSFKQSFSVNYIISRSIPCAITIFLLSSLHNCLMQTWKCKSRFLQLVEARDKSARERKLSRDENFLGEQAKGWHNNMTHLINNSFSLNEGDA